jgi:uncharacterized membrane protein
MEREQIVGRFHLAMLGFLAAITATAVYKIPEASGLPVHWGFDGRPDQIWPRDEALMVFPIIAICLTALFAAIGQFAPVERVEPGRHISAAMLTGLLGLLCALQFSLILIGVGSDIDLIRIIAFALALFWMGTGVALTQAKPIDFTGLRLPWTIKHPANWTASHWLAGGLMVVCGLGLIAVAWLQPGPVDLLIAIAAALLLPLVLGGLFSFVRSRF